MMMESNAEGCDETKSGSGDVQQSQDESQSQAKRNVDRVFSERTKRFYPVQGIRLSAIENIIKNMATGESSVDKNELTGHLNVLLDIYDFNQASRVKVAVFLNQCKITEKLMDLLKSDGQDGTTLTPVALELCQKFSSCSDSFSQELARCLAVPFFTACIKSSLSEPGKDSNENVRCYIIILHNIAMNKTNSGEFVLAKTVEVLEEVVSNSEAHLKVLSLLTLTYFYTPIALRKLKLNIRSSVTVFIDLLREAFENTEGQSRSGLKACALLAELTKLAENKEIRDQLQCKEILTIVNVTMCNTDDQNEKLTCEKFLTKIGSFDSALRTASVGNRQIAAVKPMVNSSLNSKVDVKNVSTSPDNSESTKDTECQTIKYEQGSGGDSKQLRPLDLLLIGKTGNGKSATGNMIIGRHVFTSSSSSTSVTKEVEYEWVRFEDRFLKIVDGPGVADTDNIKDFDKATQFIVEKMKHAVTFSPAGYHAFLLVVKYGSRFTAEDHVCIKMLKSIFGRDFVKNFCILLVTAGDMFMAENPDKSFLKWCEEQDGIFRELLQECNNRVLLFDNKTKDVNVRYNQVKNLIETVDNLQSGGRRYTDKHFEEMAAERDKFFLECKEPMIKEDTVIKTNFIIQDLEEISGLEEEDQRVKLIELNKRTNALKGEILHNDRGTGILQEAVETLNGLLALIKDKIDSLEEFANQKQSRSQERHDIETESKATAKGYAKKRDQSLECQELEEHKLIEEDEDDHIASEFEDQLQFPCSETVTDKQLPIKLDDVERSRRSQTRQAFKIKTQSQRVEIDKALSEKEEQIKHLQGILVETQGLALKFISDREEREERLRKEVQLKIDQMALYQECKRLMDDMMKRASNKRKSRCRLS